LCGQPVRLEGFINPSDTVGKVPPETHAWLWPLRRLQRIVSRRRTSHQARPSRNQ
jgi:hypothetical protein